jgi:hypothetical protein
MDLDERGPAVGERLTVSVADERLCPRFVGRWIEGVEVEAVARLGPDAPPRGRDPADLERRRRVRTT